MQLSTISLALTRLGGLFSPAALFAGGTVAGAWYDPSDLSTMFDSSAGTTPVAMPGLGAAVSVGLMLDKSRGLVLGSETVTNGDFNGGTTTGWTPQSAALSVVGGQLSVVPSTAFGYAYQTLTTVVGTTYRLTFNFDQSTAAFARYFVGTSVGDGSIIGLTTVSGVGSISRYFTATTTTTFIHFGAQNSSGLQALFDNISVKALPGNHAIAFNNTTARPVLMARVNLLTYSEEFDNGAWTKTRTTITTNSVTAPDGTTTADKLVETATTGSHLTRQTVTLTTGASATLSFYLKAAERNFVQIGTFDFSAVFDISNGTVVSVSGATASCTDAANGWFKCSLTGLVATASNIAQAAIYFDATTSSYTGDITKGIFIWGADLRPANIGANVPAYQRIADANTYDTSGFPLYLRFDGIDDSMYTPANLNLSGTDKVSVFAGVRKLSDAALGLFAEFSNNAASNSGAFYFAAPINTGASGNYGFYSRGSVATPSGANSSALLAPRTSVVAGLGDISGDLMTLRVDGAQAATNTADQGTGNFGTYPLYIGARNNNSLWFNGQLYSLIIAGSAVSAGNISATEQWVAGKTGI